MKESSRTYFLIIFGRAVDFGPPAGKRLTLRGDPQGTLTQRGFLIE